MNVITLASRKGGSGKSTLTAHLAAFAQKLGKRALILDADPQGSLTLWHARRSRCLVKGWPLDRVIPRCDSMRELLASVFARSWRPRFSHFPFDPRGPRGHASPNTNH